MTPLLFAWLSVAGCSDEGQVVIDDTARPEGDTDTDTDADTDTDTDTGPSCDAELASLDPADGAEAVPADVVIQASFTGPVDSVQVDLEGPDGPVPGSTSLSDDALSASFTPGAELERETTYQLTVSECGNTYTSSFVTVAAPLPESNLVDRTYDVDLNSVTWNSPTFGSLLVSQFTTDHILVMVQAVDDTSQQIDFVGAAGWTDDYGTLTQYPCTEAIDFPPVDFSANPHFEATSSQTTLDVAGYQIPVYDFTMSGSFDSDGSAIRNLQTTAYVDVRDVSYQNISLCDLAASMNDPCVACPTDEVEGCLLLDVLSSTAPWKQNLLIDPDIDPSRNPDCR